MIHYSLLIPTCRKDLIERCLAYIVKLNQPQKEYEVIVLHNATKDDIKSSVEAYSSKIPNLRYIYEEEDGLMASRHRGAREAKGEILCYLDDDSFVDKNYLLGIEETFSDPTIACANGPCLPLYETTPPKWLRYFWHSTPWGELMSELSLINFYHKKMYIPAWFVFGCNMCIRKSIFFELGGTTPDCMPPDKYYYTGDGETTLSVQLNAHKYITEYNPKIKIHHFVPKSRMTEAYFIKRAKYHALADSFTQYRVDNNICLPYDFIPQSTVSNNIRLPFFQRKWRKFLKKYYYSALFNDAIQQANELKEKYKQAHQEEFNLHQQAIKNSPELQKWILKKTYL